MRRRAVLALAGAALTGALPSGPPLAAEKPFRVGIASLVNPRTAPQFVAFEERLRQLVSAAGRELTIDFLVLDGDTERYPAAMRELASRQPDVLIAPGPEVSLKAAREVTQTIPIVMVGVDYDAVAHGYVQSLAHPGGNITGVYLNTVNVAAKRVEILKDTVPDTRRLIVFWDASGRDSFQVTGPAAQALGLRVEPVEFRDPPYDYERALAAASPAPGDALLCMLSPYFFHDRQQLDELALRYKLPSMCGGVDSGGLIAYSASLNSLFRDAADYVDKIRQGAKPGDLPIQEPTRFKLVLDLRFAKALGLTIPPLILARADEVIE
jgi:putative tryptophan/tyrosine transport system substrate-binding protein